MNNIKGIIFDLDQTLVDTSALEHLRKTRQWQTVYQSIHLTKLYPGVYELIAKLKSGGMRLCIVSSSPRPYVSKVVNYWKLGISLLVCNHDTVNHKPHPEPIRKAVQLIQLKPEQCISIGDQPNDIIASRAAGVAAIAISTVKNAEMVRCGAEQIVSDIRDTIHVIHQFGAI